MGAMESIEIYSFRTDYPDIRFLYFRNNAKDSQELIYLGIDTGISIEAVANFLDAENIIKDTKYANRKIGKTQDEWIKDIQSQVTERFVNNFFDKDGLVMEEWQAVLKEKEIEDILNKDENSSRDSAFWNEYDVPFSNQLTRIFDYLQTYDGDYVKFLFCGQQNFSFSQFVEVDEFLLAKYLSKQANQKEVLTSAFVSLFQNTEFMKVILYGYKETFLLSADLHDSSTDAFCWMQLKDVLKNKKKVWVKIRNIDELQSLSADNRNCVFYPKGLNEGYLSAQLGRKHSAAIPHGKKWIPYSYVEWVEYHNKKIWTNPQEVITNG